MNHLALQIGARIPLCIIYTAVLPNGAPGQLRLRMIATAMVRTPIATAALIKDGARLYMGLHFGCQPICQFTNLSASRWIALSAAAPPICGEAWGSLMSTAQTVC